MNLRNSMTENWGIKLISLGLSLVLWFFVTSKGKTEMTLSVPIELRNIPQDMAVVGDVAGALEVRLQGQERLLRDITAAKKVVGILDLSLTRAGENWVRLSPDDIKRPAGVAVTHMSLSEVKIILEPLVRKTFRLKPVLHGSPAPGHRVAKVAITPQRVTVEGPAGALKLLDSLQTLPIDIQDAQESMNLTPRIDYQGRSLKLLEKNISATITIERIAR